MKRQASGIILLLTLLISILFLSNIILAENEDSIVDIEEKLGSISEEEKEILEYLFIQIQEIDEMERENQRIAHEIEGMKEDIENIEIRIQEEEVNYNNNLIALEGILKTYQRMGPGSYLEIIMKSENLSDFIRRINILRDLTRNTDNVLTTIEKSKSILVDEKDNLDKILSLLEERQKDLEETIARKQEMVDEQERYLESLAGDRELYLERLNYISLMMGEVKSILGEFTQGFIKIIEEGNFPEDAVKESFTLRGIKATVEEKVFNDIINNFPWMPKVSISFNQGKIEMKAPDKRLVLVGDFEIVDNQILKFIPQTGSFFDMPLEKGTIEELFEEGDFILNFKPLIGNNILKSVEIKDGYIEILVTLKLF